MVTRANAIPPMSPAPLTTRDVKRPKGSDELRSLKRRVVGVARLDRDVVHLEDGPVLVRVRRFRDPSLAVETLRKRGRLDRATLEKAAELESPPFAYGRSLFATLEHDLALLASPAARAVVRENRRAFARYGDIDREWLAEKSARRIAIRDAIPPARWTDAVVELVVALRGAEEGDRAAKAFAALDAEPAARRAKAMDRILAIARAMETGEVPDAIEDAAKVRALYERLDAARDFPGRAKKRRTLDVLRHAIGWPELPAALAGDDLVESARRAIAEWPVVRDERAIGELAILVLCFRLGDEGAPSLAEVVPKELYLFRDHDLTLDQAVSLEKLTRTVDRKSTKKIARLVAKGLDLELLRSAGDAKGDLESVATLEDVRAARAFLTWSDPLRRHYEEHGLKLELSPELFASLPKNEDLAVLTFCLLDQHAEPTSDPIRTLDATLGLFQRSPTRAKALLDDLRRAPPGEGRRLDPAFARWLDDDALLDRAVHVAKLAGEPALSAAVREDFDRNARRERERAHLAGLPERTELQERHLASLSEDSAPPRKSRTLRRLRARVEELLPRAYRRGLDETFRRLLHEGWGIRLPKLTDAWREAVRFWLLVEDNREHLERLLREAALRPGRSVKDAFPRNAAWIASMKGRVDVDAWLAPRSAELKSANARYVLSLEEDPLEVLRMGIPFGTCLSLDGGSNAASTVLNAIEVNKRVLYVRNESKNIVARKLLGLTDDGRLVGYRLYRSVSGEEARAIQEAVGRFCAELGSACRAPLATSPAPRKLHAGFWYDDGAVPFDGAGRALPSFCRAHGLEAPSASFADDELELEAEGWHAREHDDVELALRVLQNSHDSPAMRVHDRWTIERLGPRRALREAANDSEVAVALFFALPKDEPGLGLALEAAKLLPERRSEHCLRSVLRKFPSSPKVNAALVELARRSACSTRGQRGHLHLSLVELPARFEDVASALDLLDAVEPSWRRLAADVKASASRVDEAVLRSAAAIEELYEAAPDPDAIATALMSRRRGTYAHRAALRVAARHALPGGERALRRFAALRPELMKTGDGLAALLRQSNGAASPNATPAPEEPPFDALRELVALPDVHRFLGKWDSLEGDPKSTWEAAWRRRRRRDPPGGYDAVAIEEARRKLAHASTPDEERARARDLVMDARDGEVVDGYRLLAAAARTGDAETARRVLEEIVLRGKVTALSPRVVVDLWRLEDDAIRTATARTFALASHDDWSERIQAAEREGAARGVDMSELLERTALELVTMERWSAVVEPDTDAQLRRCLGAILRASAVSHVATVFVYLQDGLSLLVFREELAKQPAERVAAIKEEIRERELTSERLKTFFTWIRDIGGIETA